MNKIGPYFGFQQYPARRLEVLEKTLDCKREIVRQIAAQHAIAEQRGAGLAPGRRHVCQQNPVPGILTLQRLNQRLGSARLAHRYRMYPDQRPCNLYVIAPESLGDMLEILRLPPRAPPQMQYRAWQERVEQQCVAQAPRIHGVSFSTAAITCPAPGTRPIPPRLDARALPYIPVAAGSVAV